MINKISNIHLHRQSKTLELMIAEESYHLSAEFLRVHSPSAEVKGHGPGQETLVYGKIEVGIEDLQPAGNYGLKIVFDDGHDSGIYTWNYLIELCQQQQALWQRYLGKLDKADKKRDPHTSVVRFSS